MTNKTKTLLKSLLSTYTIELKKEDFYQEEYFFLYLTSTLKKSIEGNMHTFIRVCRLGFKFEVHSK